MNKKLSIITINYNNCDGLRNTMASVLSQTAFEKFEYIVVDGGSSDGSLELIKSLSNRVTRWVSERDKGIYNAMNKGVSLANGEYCLFINSGDVLHDSDVINKVFPKLDDAGFIIGRIKLLKNGELSKVADPLTMQCFYNGSIPHPATFIRRDLLMSSPYDESYKIVSDWKFTIQKIIIENTSYTLLDTVISDYDCNGVSGINTGFVNEERRRVYAELIPERILLDYRKFYEGEGYKNTLYDNFFIDLREYRRLSSAIYSLDVFLMRVIAIFRKSAKFANRYPLRKK